MNHCQKMTGMGATVGRRTAQAAWLMIFVLQSLSAPAAIVTESASDKHLDRLSGLCRVWGAIKFFHPYLAYKDINWDEALVRTIPKVEGAHSPQEYRVAIAYLLSFLHDSATGVVPDEQLNQKPAAPPGRAVQPSLFVTHDNVAILTANDYDQFDQKSQAEATLSKLNESRNAKALVIDLRHVNGSSANTDLYVSAMGQVLRALVTNEISLPGARSRMYSGYPTQTRVGYQGYYSAFTFRDGRPLKPTANPLPKRPLLIVINDSTPGLVDLLAALQTSGIAMVVREHDQADGPAADEDQDSGDEYRMPLPDGVTVVMRTTEMVNADGTTGFHADRTLAAGGAAADESPGVQAALDLVRGGNPLEQQRPVAAPLMVTSKPDNPYPKMAYPSREYRLLALFRFWNVIQYFYPYKHLLDYSWDRELPELIPVFEGAGNAQEYALAVATASTKIEETHDFVGSKLLSEYFGEAAPAVTVRTVQGKAVVTHVFDEAGPQAKQLRPGDIILAVDAQLVEQRRARLSPYVAASTPQALKWRLDNLLLTGPEDSRAKLKIQQASGKTIEVLVIRGSGRHRPERPLPVYTVLPSGYGYIDLERLNPSEVDKAFETTKATPAIIFDIRGYPRGVFMAVAAHFCEQRTAVALFERDTPTSPDPAEVTRLRFSQYAEPNGKPIYRGRVVVLVNEDTVSQAEHTAIVLEAVTKGKAIFVGSPTSGADGDVTQMVLPGAITVNFNGQEVRYANGAQLQRRGIQPQIRVDPTIAGIRAGRDEVLEKAIAYLERSSRDPVHGTLHAAQTGQ
jgi:C-terminal processing protease CtpA/Prc